MTTATDRDKRRELLSVRWRMAVTDVARFEDENGISSVNGKRWRRVNDTLEELAALLVDEVMEKEYDGSDDGSGDGLLQLTEGLWREIEDRMLAWAERVEDRRAMRREQVA